MNQPVLKSLLGKSYTDKFSSGTLAEYLFHRGGEDHFKWLYDEVKFRQTLKVTARHLRFPDIRMIKDGEILDEANITSLVSTEKYGAVRRIDIDKIWTEFSAGSTIGINAIHNLDTGLFDLSTDLSIESGDIVQINAYHSPVNSRGFNIHFDTHDVLILQLQGVKEWRLAPPTFRAPLPGHRYMEFDPPSELPNSITMQAGDLLYIPRGMWHVANTVNDSSLHLTIGFYYKTFTDLVNDAMSQVKNSELVRMKMPSNIDQHQIAVDLATELKPIIERYCSMV